MYGMEPEQMMAAERLAEIADLLAVAFLRRENRLKKRRFFLVNSLELGAENRLSVGVEN